MALMDNVRTNNSKMSNQVDLSGVFRGRVENNQDPLNIGRVQVRVPMLHGVTTSVDTLPWATMCTQSAGFDYGSFIPPEVGEYVVIMFEGQDQYKPIYFGSLYGTGSSYGKQYTTSDGETWVSDKNVNEVPEEARQNESNSPSKRIVYKSPKGSCISVDETQGQESVEIRDSLGQSLLLNSAHSTDSSHAFPVASEDGTSVILTGSNGQYLSLSSKGTESEIDLIVDDCGLVIKPNDNGLNLVCKNSVIGISKNGDITIGGDNITINADKTIKVHSQGKMEILGDHTVVGYNVTIYEGSATGSGFNRDTVKGSSTVSKSSSFSRATMKKNSTSDTNTTIGKVMGTDPQTVQTASASGSNPITIALSQLTNWNSTTYLNYCGLSGGQAWCASFVSWCLGMAGYGSIMKSAAVATLMSTAKSKGIFHYKSNYTPVYGDVFILKSNGSSHTGFVQSYNSSSKTYYTIEGNHSNKVAQVTRKMSDKGLTGFIHWQGNANLSTTSTSSPLSGAFLTNYYHKQTSIQSICGHTGLCCFTTYAMIGMFYQGIKMSDSQLANLASSYTEKNGYTNTSALFSKFGYTVGAQVYKSNGLSAIKAAVKKSIDANHPMSMYMKGVWTGADGTTYHSSSNTHFVVLYAYDDNGVYIADPGKESNNKKEISWSDLMRCPGLWVRPTYASGSGSISSSDYSTQITDTDEVTSSTNTTNDTNTPTNTSGKKASTGISASVLEFWKKNAEHEESVSEVTHLTYGDVVTGSTTSKVPSSTSTNNSGGSSSSNNGESANTGGGSSSSGSSSSGTSTDDTIIIDETTVTELTINYKVLIPNDYARHTLPLLVCMPDYSSDSEDHYDDFGICNVLYSTNNKPNAVVLFLQKTVSADKVSYTEDMFKQVIANVQSQYNCNSDVYFYGYAQGAIDFDLVKSWVSWKGAILVDGKGTIKNTSLTLEKLMTVSSSVNNISNYKTLANSLKLVEGDTFEYYDMTLYGTSLENRVASGIWTCCYDYSSYKKLNTLYSETPPNALDWLLN